MPYVKFIDGPLEGKEEFFHPVPDHYKDLQSVQSLNYDNLATYKEITYKLYKFSKYSDMYLVELKLNGFSNLPKYEYHEYIFSINPDKEEVFKLFKGKKLNEKPKK